MKHGALKKIVLLALLATFAIGTGLAFMREEGSPAPQPSARGTAKLILTLPDGPAPTTIAYVVKSRDDTTLGVGTMPVADGRATTLVHDVAVAAGEGHTVTFLGSSDATGGRPVPIGWRAFDVAAGETTQVSLAGKPIAAAGTAGKADTTARAGSTDGAGAADNATTCARCQRGSAQGICDAPNLTATSTTNSQTGEQTGVGWGCSTLPTAGAQQACVALLHCLNTHDCGKRGENPLMDCYCGRAPAAACHGGEGITGACIAEYRAAAAASAEAPPAGAPLAQLSAFIATTASDPTSPLGLADNLRQCAVDTPCDICGSL